jgi:hypothetical protein
MSQAVFSAARPSPTGPQLSSFTFSNSTLIPIAPKFSFIHLVHLRPFERRLDPSVPSIECEHSNHGGTMRGKPLTYDERKAAEAAFAGQPFNSDWSADAKAVYDGIVDAMSACPVDSELEPARR